MTGRRDGANQTLAGISWMMQNVISLLLKLFCKVNNCKSASLLAKPTENTWKQSAELQWKRHLRMRKFPPCSSMQDSLKEILDAGTNRQKKKDEAGNAQLLVWAATGCFLHCALHMVLLPGPISSILLEQSFSSDKRSQQKEAFVFKQL